MNVPHLEALGEAYEQLVARTEDSMAKCYESGYRAGAQSVSQIYENFENWQAGSWNLTRGFGVQDRALNYAIMAGYLSGINYNQCFDAESFRERD